MNTEISNRATQTDLSDLHAGWILGFFWAVAQFACLFPIAVVAAPSNEDRPNILIVLVDDLGYGDLGCYGHPIMKTPHLDRFAQEGVRMTDMHSAATVCSPARAALLTGRNPYRSGFYNIAGFFGTTLQREEVTLPQLLKEVGYETAFFGKWHLSRLESETELSVNETGFDYSLATSVNAFGTGPRNPEKFIRNGQPTGALEGWYIDIISDEAMEWISNKRDDSKPFFMVLSSHEPHTPIDPPASFKAMYPDLTEEQVLALGHYGGVTRPDQIDLENLREYYGTVSQLDATFGRLMEFLEEEDLAANTLVVFTSDNGPEYPVTFEESKGAWEDPLRDKCYGSPGTLRGMKRFPYEGGHRVPGIVRWPTRIPAGTVSDKLFNGTDFLPTLCALAGSPLPEDRNIDGVDAFNAFLGREYLRPIPAAWFFLLDASHMPGMAQMAMRVEEYVLVGKFSPRMSENLPAEAGTFPVVDWLKTTVPVEFELFDIQQDHAQQVDLSHSEREQLLHLIPQMQRLWLDIRDEGPWWGRLSE
ncbi:sulfatase-like hydrolase/transferase [Lunatimonas sp.]|uniref:sulfatase family protein n=1 Tax=Lunatimonas sp. TaxID=2060141 RepID=UPI00344D8382